jgi:hypothetical protein
MDIEEAIAKVRAAAGCVDDALEAVADAKQDLQRAAIVALLEVEGGEDAERELVRRLYWEVRELPVKTLEAVVGPAGRVRELAGPGPALAPCPDCQVERLAASRTELASPPHRCKSCEQRWREQPYERWERPTIGAWGDEGDWPDDLPSEPPEWDDAVEDPEAPDCHHVYGR